MNTQNNDDMPKAENFATAAQHRTACVEFLSKQHDQARNSYNENRRIRLSSQTMALKTTLKRIESEQAGTTA